MNCSYLSLNLGYKNESMRRTSLLLFPTVAPHSGHCTHYKTGYSRTAESQGRRSEEREKFTLLL